MRLGFPFSVAPAPLLLDRVGRLRSMAKAATEADDATADAVRAALARAYDQVVRRLQNASQAEPRAILAATEGELRQVLDDLGVADARAEVDEALQRVIEHARKTADTLGLPEGVVQADEPAIRALTEKFEGDFWKVHVYEPAKKVLVDGARRALSLEPLAETVKALREATDLTVAQATSEAITQVASFDRAVNAQVAEKAGIRTWLYAGPRDGLTRDFCKALAGKVIDATQLAQLDNGQLPGVLVSAGGYRCRHRLLPVTEAMIASQGLKRATDADIEAANIGGQR